MAALAHAASLDDEIRPLLRVVLAPVKIRRVFAAVFDRRHGYARVKIVPLVSLPLNFTVKVSPTWSVSAEP